MNNAQIVKEINGLPLSEKIQIIELVLKDIRRESEEKKSLADSAKLLVDDYQRDSELTAFTLLDGEDFYESR